MMALVSTAQRRLRTFLTTSRKNRRDIYLSSSNTMLMLGPTHRSTVTLAIAACVFFTFWLSAGRLNSTSLSSKLGSISLKLAGAKLGHLPAPAALYFDQVFEENKVVYDFPGLREACGHANWTPEKENVYIRCDNLFAGLTSIMSEMKVCLKMAVEAGTGLILPTIPLRDSTDLKEFNNMHPEYYYPYDQWFDEQHLRDGLARACPKMKVLHPDALKPDQADKITIKNEWEIDVTKSPRYVYFNSHFWAGNPFSDFFETEFKKLQATSSTTGEGISVIKIACVFLLYRITEDSSGGDLRLWNDLAILMRFLEKPRKIVHNLLKQLDRPYYSVHFRVENDTVWGTVESQLAHDLDALDKAYSMYQHDVGITGKPIVYVACGDETQMKAFIDGGKARGWEVTHKYDLARQITSDGGETTKLLKDLAFDFQGAVDLGMMVRSHFFIGISGSAMSNTVAHARDVTGRYRGSSLRATYDDAGARSYLVHDGQPSSYACCL